MILFVGDKPSSKNSDPSVAFVGTKSYDVLVSWIRKMKVGEPVRFINRVDKDFESEITQAAIKGYPVIAVGKAAENAIMKLIEKSVTLYPFDMFHTLPHPSGRNRKLNNPEYIEKELRACKKFIHAFYGRTL